MSVKSFKDEIDVVEFVFLNEHSSCSGEAQISDRYRHYSHIFRPSICTVKTTINDASMNELRTKIWVLFPVTGMFLYFLFYKYSLINLIKK